MQDARGNRVMQYITPPLPGGVHPFDDARTWPRRASRRVTTSPGNLLFQHSMDAGDRWMFNDAAGKPLFAWDSRGFRSRMTYDRLHRPVGVFVSAAGDTTLDGAPRDAALPPGPEALIERRVYGETHPDTSANLRGKLYQVYDGAGVATSARYDFKGNLLTSNRRFARDYKTVPDWSALAALTDLPQIAAAAEPLLEPTPLDHPDGLRRAQPPDNGDDSGRERLPRRVQPGQPARPGGGQLARRGDRHEIRHEHRLQRQGPAGADRLRQRRRRPATTTTRSPSGLINLQTTRAADLDATASMLFKSATVVQDLRYTYDPAGNITRIEDAALNDRIPLQASAAGATSLTMRFTG